MPEDGDGRPGNDFYSMCILFSEKTVVIKHLASNINIYNIMQYNFINAIKL